MKRLFLGIPLPEATQIELAQFLEPYKIHPALKEAKWVAPKNHHVTALFLGEVPDARYSEVRELSRGVCGRMGAFSLRPNGVTCFPWKARSKMVWYRYQASLSFEELVGELKHNLAPALPNLAEEENEPMPHVTLARLREVIDPKVISFKGQPWPDLIVDHLVLFESTLTPEGSIYVPLETFPFGL